MLLIRFRQDCGIKYTRKADLLIRIIAGEFRSRLLKTPPGLAVRPTSDRLRETLFNVLGDSVRNKLFLDCYAGSGAVGLEALSRGAREAIFIEQSRDALRVLHENIKALRVEGQTRVLDTPVHRGLDYIAKQGLTPAVIYLDPPYEDIHEYERTMAKIANWDALVIAEHATRVVLPDTPGLECVRQLKQGQSTLSLFRTATTLNPM